ncbi:MAG: amino acid ABC transporter permease [Micromonosporaceae bacterium]
MSSVLYDIPGPRARTRNRVIGVLTVVAVIGLVGYVYYMFDRSGQFEPRLWQQFQFRSIQLQLVAGLVATLKAAGIAAVLALLVGAFFAAGRLSDRVAFRAPSVWVVEIFRAIPLLILMFFLFYGLQISSLWAVVFGLTLYNGSVLAEIFRAGILAVPRGQSEAAYALGMRKTQVTVSILLPQAVRSMLPAIVSQLVVLLKDTALGFIITYPELLDVGKEIGGRLVFGFPYVPTYLIVGATYISMCLFLSWFAHWLERRMREGGRKKGIPVAPLPVDPDGGADQSFAVGTMGAGGDAGR